ncbi:MAG: dienelactone hydrolase family protein [Pseudomonadota bacterium]
MSIRSSSLLILLALPLLAGGAHAYSFKTEVPLLNGERVPAYCFMPDYQIKSSLPAVICSVGVGATKIVQYHVHCQYLANRHFFVLLIDPSNHPESLAPGPYEWDRMPGYALGSVNQVWVGAKLFFGIEWYLEAIRAAVDHVCRFPQVDARRIALSGFSQPANAALTYACRDPRIGCVVWNYGGWPWIMPYDPARLPPVLIFHGDADAVYDVKYAVELAGKLRAANRCFEMYIYPGQDHMFTTYYDLHTETPAMRPALLDSFERLVSFLYRKLPPS